MSKIGNPAFNWSAPSLEKEFIKFKRVARNNIIAHKTTNKEQHGSFLREWIGDIGEEKLEFQLDRQLLQPRWNIGKITAGNTTKYYTSK